MSLAWFKFFGKDFRDGVVGKLSLEEIGAYTILLTLIYENGGPVADDEALICAKLAVDKRVWRRIRKRLIALEKLTLADGHLTNLRATSELGRALSVAEVRRTSGRSGGEQSGKSRRSALENKDNGEANASILLRDTRASPRLQNPEERESLLIADGWNLDGPALEAGLKAGLSRGEIDEAADQHRRYWSGKGTLRTRAEWAFSWDEHARATAKRLGKPVSAGATRPAIIEAPLPAEGPAWWIAAAEKLAAADPALWASYFAHCTPRLEMGVVVAATAMAAERINSVSFEPGQVAERVLGFRLQALDPRDAAPKAANA